MTAQKSNTLAVFMVIAILLVAIGVLFPIYQTGSATSPRGFVLPDGDPELGREAFVRLGCANCHSVHEVNFGEFEPDGTQEIVPLGGRKPYAISYGQLVTAIIHPSDSVADRFNIGSDSDAISAMPDLTEQMTVADMIHIVSFLLEHYEVELPPAPLPYDPMIPYNLN